jgi:hypothetical protein
VGCCSETSVRGRKFPNGGRISETRGISMGGRGLQTARVCLSRVTVALAALIISAERPARNRPRKRCIIFHFAKVIREAIRSASSVLPKATTIADSRGNVEYCSKCSSAAVLLTCSVRWLDLERMPF